MRTATQCIMAGVLTIGLAVGCAHRTRMIKIEQTGRSPVEVETSGSAVSIEETREATTQVRRETPGILSTAVHLMGEILALPFRVVGSLIRLVF